MREIGIVGAAIGAIGAALAGSFNLVEVQPEGGAARRPAKRGRKERGVVWGDSNVYASAKVRRAMRSHYQPHEGSKQIEKDRRRELINQPFFHVPFHISKNLRVARSRPIVVSWSRQRL